MQHYFLDQPLKVGQKVSLPSDISKHWIRVMRATVASKAEFVSSDNQLYIGELFNENEATVKILSESKTDVEMPINVTIVCGLPKSGKAELIVQKATELGVTRIIFVPTAWSVAKWNSKAAKKVQRLQKIAKSAAEQSHRNVIPKIEYLNGLNQLKEIKADQRIVAYEESAKQGETSKLVQVLSKLKPHQSLLAFFGPEGGISPDEIQQFEKWQYQLVGLGPRILRTETAPLYFLSAVSVISELK